MPQHAAREVRRVGDREADRLTDEEGHEGDVEPAQPQRDNTDQAADKGRQDAAGQQPQPGIDPVVELAQRRGVGADGDEAGRSEEHTSELQSLMRISYAVFCLKKKTTTTYTDKPQYH